MRQIVGVQNKVGDWNQSLLELAGCWGEDLLLGDSQEQQISWQEQVPPSPPALQTPSSIPCPWQSRNVILSDSAPASQRREKSVFGAKRPKLNGQDTLTGVALRVQVTSAPGLGFLH